MTKPRRGILTDVTKKKNAHAVALGRKGGKARAAKLSKQELSEQGRKAVLTRWSASKQK